MTRADDLVLCTLYSRHISIMYCRYLLFILYIQCLVFFWFVFLLSDFRPPVQVKRPNTGVKPQRKDSPGMQHQHRGTAGKGQPNSKPDRPTGRNSKVKDEKVGGKCVGTT